jgi:hypothetical protein
MEVNNQSERVAQLDFSSSGSWAINNEALAFYAMVAVLKQAKSINIANVLLIAPILLHQPSGDLMAKSSLKLRSTEELFLRFPMPFINFNKRYASLMAVSFNAINMLLEFGLAKIEENKIVALEVLSNVDFEKNRSKRLKIILKGGFKLAEFINENPRVLYSALAIKL